MPSPSVLKKIYTLARPYGRKRLAFVASVICLQGVVQTAGVTSIFPFLALASDTAAVRRSSVGSELLARLPEMADQTLLILAGLVAIGMLFLANGLHLLTIYSTTRYTRGLGHWLRVRLLKQITGQEYGYFLRHSTAVMMRKINGDVQLYIQSVLVPLFTASAGLINVTLLSLTLLIVDPTVALGAGLVLGLVYFVIYGLLTSHRREFSKIMRTTNRESVRQIQQFLGGIKPIKVHGVEQTFIDRFSKLSYEQSRVQAKHNVFQVAPKNIIEPMGLGTLIGIVILYAARGDGLATVLPTMGLMAMASYRLLPNIQNLYGAASMFSSNLHSLDEVYEEFHGAEIRQAGHRQKLEKAERLPWEHAIELRDLCFRYPGSTANVIDHIDLSIPKNSSVAFVGQTGCGKSTLVDLILGLHTPVSGGVYIDDTPLVRANHRNWRTGVGYVPQDIFLLDDTITANVAIGQAEAEIDQDQLRYACAAAQILDFIENELPQGWQTQVGERGVRLSGGQRQRIGLARALYHRPDVLVLDEATSALDHSTEAEVMKAISALEGELTMIIVAHRLTTIQWCDQVVELEAGKVAPRSKERLAARS